MAISFSGLASGLDTSSWVESLVALKQAKIDTLEEQKETVLLSRETLNNIKSFFNSFRSVIEKVTDAKYGVASMDIFAQKLATSSDLNILTASATTEAEEAEYNVLVDNLATSTEAVSGLKVLNTIIETATAVGNTKLVDLGIKVGEIGIDNNGIYNIIQIEKNDTIESFIAKLHNIGVDATYNSKTGIFGINLDDGSIDDTLTIHDDGSVGTGILDIFNLHEKGGYESTYLQTSTSETIVNAATSSTKLSELGSIKAGNIQVKANGTSYNLSIDGNTTLGGLVSSLNSLGVDAKLASNGVLTINDAEIVDSGNTGIITALGLETDINSKTQTASGLKTVVVTTTDAAATGATKLSELGSIKSGNIQVKANGALYTIAISGSTTLQGLIDALSAKGVDASLSSDGVFTVKNAEIIDSGNTGLISALGLQVDVNSKTQSSIDLRTVVTTTTQSAATGSTKLSQLGSIKNGNILVKANNTTYTIAINTSTTLQGLIDALKAKGISAELSGDGTLTINDAEIIDNNTGIINALGLEKEVSSKTQTANNLSYKSVITTSSEATSSTQLGDLSLWSELSSSPVLTAKNSSGGTTYITLTSTTTIEDVVTRLNSAGLSATFSSSGVLAVTGGEVSGNAAEVLGIKSGSENTSLVWANGNILFTQGVNYAVASNTLGELGISTAKPAGGYALAVYNSSNALVKEISVSSSTRLDDIFTSLGSYGITATIDEGKINLNSSNGNYIKGSVADALGISTITSVIVNSTNASSSSAIKYTVTQVISGTTTFEQAGLNAAGKVLEIKTKENGVTQAYITIASNTTTFDSMFSSLATYGFSASINDGVLTLSSTQYVVGGSMAELLGIETYATSDAYTVGQAITSTANMTYTGTIYATESSLIKDFITLDGNATNNSIKIYSNYGQTVTTVTVTASTTFDDLRVMMRSAGVDMRMSSNGKIYFNSNDTCAYAVDVPASDGILSKLGIGKQEYGLKTVVLSQTSTAAVTATNTTYKTITDDTTIGEYLGFSGTSIIYEMRYSGSPYEGSSYESNYNSITVQSAWTVAEFVSRCNSYFDYINVNYNSTTGISFSQYYPEITSAEIWDNELGAYKTVTYTRTNYYLSGELISTMGLRHSVTYAAQMTSRTFTGGTVYANTTNGWSLISDKTVYYTTLVNGTQTQVTITGNTTFVDLGLHDGSSTSDVRYFSVSSGGSNTSRYFTITNSTTVNDYLLCMRNCGINSSLSNGRITLSTNGQTHISGEGNINLVWDVLGLDLANDFFTQAYTTIRSTTTFEELGFVPDDGASNKNNYIKIHYSSTNNAGGTSTTNITLVGSTTVGQFIQSLNSIGISATLSDGKITIAQGSDGKFLVGSDMYWDSDPTNKDDELWRVLNLNVGLGYTYNISKSVTYTSTGGTYRASTTGTTGTITASTTLHDLGFENKEYELFNYVTITNAETSKSGSLAYSVHESSTVNDLVAYINGTGKFFASISDGKLTISGRSSGSTMTYINRFSKIFSDTFKLNDAGEDVTFDSRIQYKNTGVEKTYRIGAIALDSGNKRLSELGLTDNATISMNNTNGDVTWKIITPNMTVENFFDFLTDYGVTTSRSGGIITIGSLNDSEWLEYISENLQSVLRIAGTGAGKTYEIIGNAAYENTSSRTIKNITTHTATATTTLESISGYNAGNGNIIVHKADGTSEELYVDSSSTIQDFFNQIAAYGLTGSISAAGVVTITGNGNTFLSSASGGSNLVSLLKLSLNKTSTTGTVNTTTGTISSTAQVVATSDTLLGNLAYANGTKLTFDSSGFASLVMQTKTREGLLKNFTVNFSKTSTLGSVLDAFKAQGLNASIDATGRFSVSTDSLSDFNISGALGTYLMGASYNKSYETKGGTPLSASSVNTVTAAATRETKLADLGVTTGEYNIYNNGVKFTAQISSDETLGSFIDTLSSFGIQAGLINNGSTSKLIITGSGNSYIAKSNSVSNSSNVVEKLFGSNTTADSYKYTGKEILTSTSTSTQAADSTALLSAYGVTAGEYYIYTNGNRHTLQISSDETIGSLMETLSSYGIKAELVKNGNSSKIVLTGSGDAYIAQSSNTSNASNIVNKLFGGSSAIVNESSYTGSQRVTTKVTATVAASESTSLASLGVTAGEYYIYNNGVKYTALISSDETLGSFMNTLKSFGIQTGLINNGSSASLVLIGNGNSYVAKSNSVSNASNVVEKLFGTAGPDSSFSYTGSELLYKTVTHTATATEDTLLSTFDTPWGDTTLKSAGNLALQVDGKNIAIQITDTETFGSLIDKLEAVGVQASFVGGKLYISEMNGVSILANGTTSSIINPNANIHLAYKSSMDGFMESTSAIVQKTTIIEDKTLSAANYAGLDTQLKTLNITGGTFSIFRNGEKATINVNSDNTFDDLRSQIASRFSDVDLKFEEGKLVIYSKDDDVELQAGTTTDTSNLLAVTGLAEDEEGRSVSARALYCVNESSVLTQTGLFRKGDVKEGTFYVGDQMVTITNKSTLSDIISQINSSDTANATAYWDSINGRLVIKSRSTGQAFINIEAGTSNFTDIMGYTETEWYTDGSVKKARMVTDSQNLGENSKVSINGTTYTSTSNILTSDITRIKGLTINLNGLTSGSAVKLTVEKDKETVANSLSDIVDSYNELMKNVDEAVAKDGSLKNQTTLKMLRNQIRSAMMSSIGNASVFKNLDAIGISVTSASANNVSTSNESIINLTFDKDKFLDAYEADSDAVKELLIGSGIKGSSTATDGVFTKVESIVENSLQSVIGYFSIADAAYAREINKIDNKIVSGNEAIEKYRARLNKKFNSMDMLISNMQNQYSSFLS